MGIKIDDTKFQDEKLKEFIKNVKTAVDTFIEAAAKMEYAMRFKAFMCGPFESDEAWKAFEDVIQAAVIQSLEPHSEFLKTITVNYASEKLEHNCYDVWLHAKIKEEGDDEVPESEPLPANSEE